MSVSVCSDNGGECGTDTPLVKLSISLDHLRNKLQSSTEINKYPLYIILHLHNSFLFQCDVTRSLTRYESPEQTVY